MKENILLLGEAMGLFIAEETGMLPDVSNYSVNVAGAELNVAIGLTRLNHNVSYCTKLGKDLFAKWIESVFEKNNISTERILYSDQYNTGFMFKSKVENGDPDIYYYRKNSAASTMSVEDVEELDFSSFTHVHITGIFAGISLECLETTRYVMKKAKRLGIPISFDPNIRQQLWKSETRMVEVLNDLASYATVVLPGIGEGKILTGSDCPKEIAKFYLDLGVQSVLVKVGAKGVLVADKENMEFVNGFVIDKVVDTVGAGDGFVAGVISAMAEGLPMKECAKRGAAIGAIQVTHKSDNEGLPTKSELQTFMETHKVCSETFEC